MEKKVNQKHKYSTFALLIIGGILFIGWIAAWDTGTVDLLCNTNNSLLKRDGTWGCSVTAWAEGYFHNYTNPKTISIPAADTYYNISGYDGISSVGFGNNGEAVIIQKTAWYHLTGHLAFTGGNSGDYEFELFKNGQGINQCAGFRSTTSNALGSASFGCIIQCNEDDELVVKIKDISAPAQNINLYQFNFNIVEIQ